MSGGNLEQEIHEQPSVLQRIIEQESRNVERLTAALRGRFDYIVIAARGSSDNAARYAKYLFGARNEVPVALATPSVFTLYRQPPVLEGALVMGISQSGRPPDVVSVVEEGRRQGRPTLAITNDPASPLAGAADYVINLHASPEKAIAATKTYTASLAALALVSSSWDENQGALAQLQQIPDLVHQTLTELSSLPQQVERYRYMEHCAVIGRGFNYATVFEVSLKIKELTHIVAEPYSSADFRHGPVVMVAKGFPVLVVAPHGQVYPDVYDLMAELHERGADLIVISDQKEAVALSQTPCLLPVAVEEWLSPLITVLPGQLFALHLALSKGIDPDHPRGLSKVTLTR